MRKHTLTFSLLLLISQFTFSQQGKIGADKQSVGQTSFIAEAGGPGIAFSANLDRRFKPSRLGWGGRVGLGFVSAYDDYYDPATGNYYGGEEESAITFPVQLNYIFGKENSPHALEVGAGLTYVSKKLNIMNFDSYNEDKRTQLFGTFSFMYRRQPVNGGFSWRIGFTPLIAKSYIQAFGAVSVGYNF
jgi:hypothetical protein